jgi:hypothetical protein
MGRRKSLVFDHWSKPSDNKVSCRYCHHTTVANSTRMESHLSKDCLKVPHPIRLHFTPSTPPSRSLASCLTSPRIVQQPPPNFSPSDNHNRNLFCDIHSISDSTSEDESGASSSNPKKMRLHPSSSVTVSETSSSSTVQSSIQTQSRSFFDHMTNVNRAMANRKLAAFIYSCNLPFSLIDHPKFRDFVHSIRPAYEKVMPHRKMVSIFILRLNVFRYFIFYNVHVYLKVLDLLYGRLHAFQTSYLKIFSL